MNLYAFPGQYITHAAVAFINPVTAFTGSITSITYNRREAFRVGQIVYMYIDFTITNNGTGAGSLSLAPPGGSDTVLAGTFPSLMGREIALTGDHIHGAFTGAGYDMTLLNGAYPGGTNRRIVVSGYYLGS